MYKLNFLFIYLFILDIELIEYLFRNSFVYYLEIYLFIFSIFVSLRIFRFPINLSISLLFFCRKRVHLPARDQREPMRLGGSSVTNKDVPLVSRQETEGVKGLEPLKKIPKLMKEIPKLMDL